MSCSFGERLDARPSALIPRAVLTVLLVCAPESARAAILTVTDCGDTTPGGAPGQLRRLINDAAAGDTIAVPACTITLTGAAGEDANAGGDLDILKNLTIQGAGPGTILNGNRQDRVLEVHAGVAADVSALFVRNGASLGSGGGIANHGTLHLASVRILDNDGGVFNDGTLTLAASRLVINNGYAIDNQGALTLDGSTVTQNDAGCCSGAIRNWGTLTVSESTISNNHLADGSGAGIANFGTAIVVRSTISGNHGGSAGGGIYNARTLTLLNSTVSGNFVTGLLAAGGGLYNTAAGDATLTSVTLTRNAAPDGSGIRNQGALSARNTLIADNACSGTVTSGGHNIDSGTSCGFSGPGDLSGTDPKLGFLADNGGATWTHALLAGSPAIDAGDDAACPATDQRGVPRPQGPACDIGSYELRPGAFFSLAPCRLADTRSAEGPALAANAARIFAAAGRCAIPSDAVAAALIVTTVQQTDFGDLRLYPAGGDVPSASAINFATNHVRANNAIIRLGVGGQIGVQCDMSPGSTGTTHLIMDVYGYFK